MPLTAVFYDKLYRAEKDRQLQLCPLQVAANSSLHSVVSAVGTVLYSGLTSDTKAVWPPRQLTTPPNRLSLPSHPLGTREVNFTFTFRENNTVGVRYFVFKTFYIISAM